MNNNPVNKVIFTFLVQFSYVQIANDDPVIRTQLVTQRMAPALLPFIIEVYIK